MVNGLYTSGNSMQWMLMKQDLASNALSNSQVPGFKISRLATSSEIDQNRDNEGFWRQRTSQVDGDVYTDYSPGPMMQTGNPLDFALEGDGFLQVDTGQGRKFLRGGSFRLDGEKRIVDLTGARLLDAGGNPITVTGKDFSVAADGTIRSGGEEMGKIALVDFPRPYRLKQEGAGRFSPEEPRPGAVRQEPTPAGEAEIRQGFLEGANVQPVETMVQMIAFYRNYEADSRVIAAIDSTLDKAVNSVGRV